MAAMRSIAVRSCAGLIFVLLASCGAGGGGGSADAYDPVLQWNHVALDAAGIDHELPPAGADRSRYGEQFGPTRTARAFAIVHLAMFDAVNAIDGSYDGYALDTQAAAGTSLDAAVAQAAHDTLAALYPAQVDLFDRELEHSLGAGEEGAAARKTASRSATPPRRRFSTCAPTTAPSSTPRESPATTNTATNPASGAPTPITRMPCR